MLKEQHSATRADDNSEWQLSEILDLRTIIQDCPGLPDDVTSAKFTSVNHRILDQSLLSFLIKQSVPRGNDQEWSDRRQDRQEALSPYLGRVLIGVFIRLPGIHYTIEVDPELERVVHWEWQTT